eukprot:g4874.t1
MTLGEQMSYAAEAAKTPGARDKVWSDQMLRDDLRLRAEERAALGPQHFDTWKMLRDVRDKRERRAQRARDQQAAQRKRFHDGQRAQACAHALRRWQREKGAIATEHHKLPGHRNPLLGFELPYCYHPESFGSAYSDPRYVRPPAGIGNCCTMRNGRALRQCGEGKWRVVPAAQFKDAARSLLQALHSH